MMMNSWQSLRLLLLGVAWTGLLVDRSAAFVVPMSHYHRHHPLSITGRKYIGKASLGTLSESEANNNEPDVKFSRGVPESSTTNLDAKSQTAKRPAEVQTKCPDSRCFRKLMLSRGHSDPEIPAGAVVLDHGVHVFVATAA